MNIKNIGISLLIVFPFVVIALYAGYIFKGNISQKNTQLQQQKQSEQKQNKDHDTKSLRIDPLGKFTSPGQCVGWICF